MVVPNILITEVAEETATEAVNDWRFTVKVTQGESTDICAVATEKVKALVKTTADLTGTWATPEQIAAEENADHTVKVTVTFGTATAGFLKLAE